MQNVRLAKKSDNYTQDFLKCANNLERCLFGEPLNLHQRSIVDFLN